MPITITSKQTGFRRCGVDHPATATEYPDNTFTAAQLKILQAEPMLVVQVSTATPKQPNVGESVALVQAAVDSQALDLLAEGETRKGVLDAIVKRRAELANPAE